MMNEQYKNICCHIYDDRNAFKQEFIYFWMFVNEIEKLGLNKNEAKVYDALLQLKSSPAGKLIKLTKLHRNIVYDNLEKLIDKGLVSYILEGKKKVFQAQSPHFLVEMIRSKKKEFAKKLAIAENLEKKILQQQKILSQFQEASIFRGTAGIKKVMDLTLSQKKDYVVLGAPKQAVELMPPVYWENFNKKIQAEGIKVRMIFNAEMRDWSKKIQHRFNEIRFLPKHFDSLTETNICEDRVSFFIWSKPPLIVTIVDKNLAKGYLQHFEYLWKRAKK